MIGFIFLFCLLFRWGVLHRVLLVIGWCRVLYSSDFLFVSSHYLIPAKAIAPHSSTLAWKIPWVEETGRLQSMGSLRVRHDWTTSFSLFTFMHWRRKWQPAPVFLPGESQGWGEPGRLPSMGLHRVGHNWIDLAVAAAAELVLL